MPTTANLTERIERFCTAFGMDMPILLAPMAGACPPSLSIAVANGGGFGACGASQMQPDAIAFWAEAFRAESDGGFQINLWVPDEPPKRRDQHETRVREFLSHWGPEVPAEAGDRPGLDFDAQCEAVIAIAPPVISSVMGLFPPSYLKRIRQAGIRWFAHVTTLSEAKAADAAGADAIVVQGMEAGGHRGSFEPGDAKTSLIGLFSLLPAVADTVKAPVVATGGIADGRGVAAALLLGASAVAVGTGFLRCPEAKLAPAWADAIGHTGPDDTILTNAFSGRLGRSIATAYARAAAEPDAPTPAPHPIQRRLTQAMRDKAMRENDIAGIQAWAGQSAWMARPEPAADVAAALWRDAKALLTHV